MVGMGICCVTRDARPYWKAIWKACLSSTIRLAAESVLTLTAALTSRRPSSNRRNLAAASGVAVEWLWLSTHWSRSCALCLRLSHTHAHTVTFASELWSGRRVAVVTRLAFSGVLTSVACVVGRPAAVFDFVLFTF